MFSEIIDNALTKLSCDCFCMGIYKSFDHSRNKACSLPCIHVVVVLVKLVVVANGTKLQTTKKQCGKEDCFSLHFLPEGHAGTVHVPLPLLQTSPSTTSSTPSGGRRTAF